MFKFGKDSLTLTLIDQLTKGSLKGEITASVKKQINASRAAVEKMAQGEAAVYGINTGFGPLCDTKISTTDTGELQKNLLLSHAVGVGNPISKSLSKCMILCKIHALCQGYSGVRFSLIEQLLYWIEHDLIPVVPEQGSVGASGDLAPLSHLFLPLLGEGEFWIGQERIPAKIVLEQHQRPLFSLEAKEGLALINGTQFILAHAIEGLNKMAYLLDLADVAGAMSLEGAQGSQAPFKKELHKIRPFDGNIKVAQRLRHLFQDSENMASHTDCDRVQDPYSLRCMPQVHGASRNAWLHLEALATIEMNAVTDNPIIINKEEAISGGNFHGQPLAMALDYTTMAAAELGNIADRRCYLLLENKNGLPRLLTPNGGLNSGMMIPQYTTAALVTENKTLCFPASVDSIPTSLGQEDHVSMGSISGRKFNQVLENLEKILAIELMYGAQAITFRRPLKCATILEDNLKRIREKVPQLENDRLLKTDIDHMITMVQERTLIVDDKALGINSEI